MDASTQTDVEKKNFSQQTGEEEGKWEEQLQINNISLKKGIEESPTVKYETKKNNHLSKKKKQNKSTQKDVDKKEKGIQTTWIINKIDMDETKTSARTNVLSLLAKTHFFKKMHQEFATPPAVSPIHDEIEENSRCKIGEDKQDWSNWKSGEFSWNIENVPENISKKKEENKKRKISEEGAVKKIKREQKNQEETKEKTKEKQVSTVQQKDLDTLTGTNWLNDEIINQYFDLIGKRGNLQQSKYPKVYSFNSFFFPRLHVNGYEAIKRWTKRTNIFEYDRIIVPIHLGNHWCLGTINLSTKTISYFDSLMGENRQYMETLLDYLTAEAKQKGAKPIIKKEWTLITRRDTPRQLNGYDCGVFACLFAKYESANREIDFNQEKIPQMRKKITQELLSGELID